MSVTELQRKAVINKTPVEKKVNGDCITIPIWKKHCLSIEEAEAYSGIGKGRLRDMVEEPDCEFVLYIGRKILVKRKKLEEYLEKSYIL